MKTRLTVVMTAVLVVVLASVALGAIVFAQEGEEPESAPQELEQPAVLVLRTRPWSAVGSTCVPDDDTPASRYNSDFNFGFVEFSSLQMGDLYFTCMVNTPIDQYDPGLGGREPDWNRLTLTYMDPGANGYVEAKLIRKHLTNGVAVVLATVLSNANQGAGIRFTSVPLNPAIFDFDTYVYFVRVRLNRTVSMLNLQFHIVSLRKV
jgi:hypothetical protein